MGSQSNEFPHTQNDSGNEDHPTSEFASTIYNQRISLAAYNG